MKDDKKSIIKEAILNLEEIKEAADVNAKKKLAEEFPEKFNNLLKEELNKKKESYKKINENKESDSDDNNKENNENSVMKETKQIIKKGPIGSGKPFDKKTKKAENVEETVNIVDTVGDSDPFDKNAKKQLQTEEFNITELDAQSVGSALENADEDDEIITMDEIENEIANMEDLDGELENNEPEESSEDDNLSNELNDIKDKLESIIQSMAGENQESEEEFNEPESEESFEDEESEEELNEGLNDTLQSLDPNNPQDTNTIKKLFSNAFKGILTDPYKWGNIKKAFARATPQELYVILQKYFDPTIGGGTIRLDNDGKLTYGSKALKSKSTMSTTAPDVSSKAISGGGTLEEGLSDTLQNLDPNDPKNANTIKRLFTDAFKGILTDPYKWGNIKKAFARATPQELFTILQKYVEFGGGTIRLDNSGKLVYGSKGLQSKSTMSTTAPDVSGKAISGGGTLEEYEDTQISDDDIDAILNSDEEDEIDETHGVTYAERRKITGRHNPDSEYLSSMELDQSPENVQESKLKITRLIEENKKLTKKLNESKKYKDSITPIMENYKTVLEKYRNQLKDMAVFNTNLSHVNNLLVNEELALTHDDKIKIINEFKKVDKIVESEKKYKAILSEMKASKKSLTESVEDRVVTTSIQPSSKNNLDEVVEKTAYEDNDHIKKMKKLIEYVENRGKKIIK